MSVTRKLTAILSADVKGYSRLISEDEEATVRTLTAYREVMASLIQEHRGRVVDSPGDNLLAEFASVMDAVQCAAAIQHELKTRNDSLADERKMEFRIGINLGDVIVDGERIYGDGVNVAARLEGLAEGGGVCISGTVYDQVKTKLALGFEDLGEQGVKNIAEPVRAYRVRLEPEAAGTVRAVKRTGSRRWRVFEAWCSAVIVGWAAIWNFYLRAPAPQIEPASVEKMAFLLPKKPSIAVLPFINLSEDPQQEHFADGITENIITALAQIPNLFVIARNSTFTYKGKPVKVQQVAEDLGVRYVLEGSMQRSGDRVRINVQLIDALKGHHLWAKRYDREVKDIFTLQDDITQKIVTALEVKLNAEERARHFRRMTSNAEAYEYLLRGLQPFHRVTKEDNTLAREMFEKTVELDPRSAAAWTFLAWTHAQDVRFRWSEDPHHSLKQAKELAQKALALDDSYPGAYSLLGDLHLIKREHERAIALGRKAVVLAPNVAVYKAILAMTLFYSGRPQEAVPLVKEAMRLDPHYPAWFLWSLGNSYRLMGRYKQAIGVFKEHLARESGSFFPHLNLATSYSQAGQLEKGIIKVLTPIG